MEAYQRLEQQWAEFNGLDPAGMVSCSSGTAALHLAFECLRLTPGSEVIMSDYNMIACPRAAVMAGLRPVFVDCDERLCIDWKKIPAPRSSHGAVLFTHIYGRRCNDIDGWSPNDGRRVVEDLAEAHGVRPGRWTDAACWSFYRNKQVAGEEGGAVWFKNPKHAKLARSLRSLGFTDAHDFMHIPRGHNYRMSNTHAELILKSLAQYPENLTRRQEAVLMYNEHCPAEWLMPVRDALWVYDLRIEGLGWSKMTEVVRALQVAEVAARHGFKPMTMQDEFSDYTHPIAYQASREIIYLPLTPGLVTPEFARRAFEVIRRVIKQNG